MSFGGPGDDVIFFPVEENTNYKSIERIDPPSTKEFLEKYYRTGTPVIITGLVEKWPAFHNFNEEYLKNKWGNVKVTVDESPNDYFPDDVAMRCENKTKTSTMMFSEFLSRLRENEKTCSSKLYLQHTSLDMFNDMSRDIILPEYVNKSLLQSCNIWFGGGKLGLGRCYNRKGLFVNLVALFKGGMLDNATTTCIAISYANCLAGKT